ncbi:MAG: hypothetical protein H6Q67_2387 [Firmicutes bacterium]|nr:hypothetical protein [Bacillota bacterium]
MWYAFNSRGKCIGAFTHKPLETVLEERSNPTIKDYAKEVNTANLSFMNGDLIDKTPQQTTTTTTTTDGKTS